MNAEETVTLTRSELVALIEAAVTEALSEVASDLELRERQKEAMRERYANDPDYRERLKEAGRARYAAKKAAEREADALA